MPDHADAFGGWPFDDCMIDAIMLIAVRRMNDNMMVGLMMFESIMLSLMLMVQVLLLMVQLLLQLELLSKLSLLLFSELLWESFLWLYSIF